MGGKFNAEKEFVSNLQIDDDSAFLDFVEATQGYQY